jgi:3-hydroxyisobutyrate dehydrogenase-like beta-hydroxyacid dehydrogenase
MPAFADFAREAHDLGRFGNGTRMKLVANLLVAIHNVASAEAMVLGAKAGSTRTRSSSSSRWAPGTRASSSCAPP